MFKTNRSLPHSQHLDSGPYSESANLVHTVNLFFKIHSNTIFPPKAGLPLRFTNKIMRTSIRCNMHYMLSPSDSPQFVHLSNIWREVPDMKLQIMSFQFLPAFCFISLFSQSSLLNIPF